MPVSQRPGMGAIPYDDQNGPGVTFRVWAPFADEVSAAGDFNGWSTSANPLFKEGNGYWSTDVPGARTGQEYKFVINPIASLWRMDPYVRQIRHGGSGLNGVIAPTSEGSSTPGYSTPAWNEMVIYEVHIRTFLYGGGF